MKAEDYTKLMEKQIKQYDLMMKNLIERQAEQFNKLMEARPMDVSSAASETSAPMGAVDMNPNSTWIKGDDGEDYLLLNRDAAQVIGNVLEKTSEVLKAIADAK